MSRVDKNVSYCVRRKYVVTQSDIVLKENVIIIAH